MEKSIRIVGLGGSLVPNSTSLAALKVALKGAEEAGAEVEIYNIRDLDLPFYVPGREAPEIARRLADSVCHAGGMIWSSPMYHGSISGSFKNAIDWLDLLRKSDPPFLTDKVIGLISTAGGIQGLQAVNTMEFCVRALRGWAVPLVMPVARASEAFDESGIPRDAEIERQLKMLGAEVVRAARQFAAIGTCDYASMTHARD